MGLYKRKDSHSYWMKTTVNGKACCKSTETDNKRMAEKIYAKWITEITEGKWFPESVEQNISMSHVIGRYMKEVSPLKKGSYARDTQIAAHLKLFLGILFLKMSTLRY